MSKIKVGITGQSGFIGYHLFYYLATKTDNIELVQFNDNYFSQHSALQNFVNQCDTIVHLAAMNRGNEKEIYDTNIRLVQELISALRSTSKKTHVIFASSVQEHRDNVYGRSKKEGHKFFEDWAATSNGISTILIIPNVFGAFCKPHYNSAVATFCYQLSHDQIPEIQIDAELPLIYVNDLVDIIYQNIISKLSEKTMEVVVPATVYRKVSDILHQLHNFKNDYLTSDLIPELKTAFDVALFNTFRSYIDYSYYPHKISIKADERGYLVENIKSKSAGQTFFSVTNPGIIRGNHYHFRKFERFCVISGEAVIRLRKIDTQEVVEYRVSGEEPAFIDIPIYHTHNIENIGTSKLLTIFWCNEFYNPNDSDTYFENVI